jgi:predicted nucleic acid-binding protein
VSQTYFFDTSALVQLYHYEVGTERVEEIFDQSASHIVISELATVELYAALARRYGWVKLPGQRETKRYGILTTIVCNDSL